MQKMLLKILIGITCLVLIGYQAQALAQSQNSLPTPVIAIIDYREIERSSLAWQSFSQQFSAIKDRYQAEVKLEQDKLQKWQDELQQQSTILSPESFAAEEKKFREAVRTLQNQTDQHKTNLDNLFKTALTRFRTNIATITSEVAQEKNINIVLDKSAASPTLFFWANDLIITQEVLKRFNERFPTVSISDETGGNDSDASEEQSSQ